MLDTFGLRADLFKIHHDIINKVNKDSRFMKDGKQLLNATIEYSTYRHIHYVHGYYINENYNGIIYYLYKKCIVRGTIICHYVKIVPYYTIAEGFMVCQYINTINKFPPTERDIAPLLTLVGVDEASIVDNVIDYFISILNE